MKKYIFGNWKMNNTKEEATALISALEAALPETENEIAVFPSYPYLETVKNAAKKIKVGAQGCFYEQEGAFTGEVSAKQLADFAQYVLAGHSERRHVFGETNEDVTSQVRSILEEGMTPVLCVGETQEEKDGGQTESVIKGQIESVLNNISKEEAGKIIVAYEPVWAIGTGNTCSKSDAEAVISFIDGLVKITSGGKKAPILYGGSVKADNAQDFFSDITSGVLVGGASLDANEFLEIIRKAG